MHRLKWTETQHVSNTCIRRNFARKRGRSDKKLEKVHALSISTRNRFDILKDMSDDHDLPGNETVVKNTQSYVFNKRTVPTHKVSIARATKELGNAIVKDVPQSDHKVVALIAKAQNIIGSIVPSKKM